MVDSSGTRVLPPEFDRRYPVVVRGDGVWLEDSSGRRYLDAMSGGSMAATLGHGRRDLVEAARRQALRLAYVHNERPTNPLQERLAERRRLLLRGDQRGRPAGVYAAPPLLGGSRGASARARLPRLLRRGRHRNGPHGPVVRGERDAADPGRRRNREGSRRRLHRDR